MNVELFVDPNMHRVIIIRVTNIHSANFVILLYCHPTYSLV